MERPLGPSRCRHRGACSSEMVCKRVHDTVHIGLMLRKASCLVRCSDVPKSDALTRFDFEPCSQLAVSLGVLAMTQHTSQRHPAVRSEKSVVEGNSEQEKHSSFTGSKMQANFFGFFGVHLRMITTPNANDIQRQRHPTPTTTNANDNEPQQQLQRTKMITDPKNHERQSSFWCADSVWAATNPNTVFSRVRGFQARDCSLSMAVSNGEYPDVCPAP